MTNKEKTWNYWVKKTSLLKDGRGMRIDAKIKSVVIGLNVNGINTFYSCGGHSSRGVLFPYVMCSPKTEPKYRFKGQRKIENYIIKKYKIKKRQIFANKEAQKEYDNIVFFGKIPLKETVKYKNWTQKIEPFEKKMEEILKEFYEQKTQRSKSEIIFEKGPYGYPRFLMRDNDRKIPQKKLLIKLKNEQKEMSLFGEFLKNKYFK